MWAARRRAVHDWLTLEGMTRQAAESWCGAWQSEAATRGLHPTGLDFWVDAGPWIAERLRTRQSDRDGAAVDTFDLISSEVVQRGPHPEADSDFELFCDAITAALS
jgi:hypothetical protein